MTNPQSNQEFNQGQAQNPLQQGNVYNINPKLQIYQDFLSEVSRSDLEEIVSGNYYVGRVPKLLFWKLDWLSKSNYLRKGTLEVWKSQVELSEMCDISINQCEKGISALKRAGYILLKRGNRRYNVYTINYQHFTDEKRERGGRTADERRMKTHLNDSPVENNVPLKTVNTFKNFKRKEEQQPFIIERNVPIENIFSEREENVPPQNVSPERVDVVVSFQKREEEIKIPEQHTHAETQKANNPQINSERRKELNDMVKKLGLNKERVFLFLKEYGKDNVIRCLEYMNFEVSVQKRKINNPGGHFLDMLRKAAKGLWDFSQFEAQARKQEIQVKNAQAEKEKKEKEELERLEEEEKYGEAEKYFESLGDAEKERLIDAKRKENDCINDDKSLVVLTINDIKNERRFAKGETFFKELGEMLRNADDKQQTDQKHVRAIRQKQWEIENGFLENETEVEVVQLDEENAASDKKRSVLDTFRAGMTSQDRDTLSIGQVLEGFNPVKRPAEQVKPKKTDYEIQEEREEERIRKLNMDKELWRKQAEVFFHTERWKLTGVEEEAERVKACIGERRKTRDDV
jgi:hypothetical protein